MKERSTVESFTRRNTSLLIAMVCWCLSIAVRPDGALPWQVSVAMVFMGFAGCFYGYWMRRTIR